MGAASIGAAAGDSAASASSTQHVLPAAADPSDAVLRIGMIVAVAGAGLANAAIAVAIAYIPQFARVTRSASAQVRNQEFVDAARVAHVAHPRVLWTHILPNVSGPIIVLVTVGLAMAITGVAALSFLGLGAQPPSPEWGAMLAAGREQLSSAPHISMFPGLAILVTVLGLNLLGDGLRDVFDPRSR